MSNERDIRAVRKRAETPVRTGKRQGQSATSRPLPTICRWCGRIAELHEADGSCPPDWEEG